MSGGWQDGRMAGGRSRPRNGPPAVGKSLSVDKGRDGGVATRVKAILGPPSFLFHLLGTQVCTYIGRVGI